MHFDLPLVLIGVDEHDTQRGFVPESASDILQVNNLDFSSTNAQASRNYGLYLLKDGTVLVSSPRTDQITSLASREGNSINIHTSSSTQSQPLFTQVWCRPSPYH